MKFSCEFEGIDYFFETVEGTQSDAKYYFLLSAKEKDRLNKGKMKYYHLNITATKGETQLNFYIPGIPLSPEDELQIDELEDFFENQCTFSKVEHMFELQEREEKTPQWANK